MEGELVEVHVWRRDQAAAALRWLLAERSRGYILASGQSVDESDWARALQDRAPVYVYRPGDSLPIELAYRTPQTLGIDRLAAVIGARTRFPGRDCLIVSAGTCITVEHLSASGVYLGGSISPGIGMRLRSMHEHTGRLPLVDAVLPKGAPIGTTTASALQQGAIRGAAHELLGWWREASRRGLSEGGNTLRKAAGHEADVQLVLCGGDAPLLRPLLPGATAVRPYLVLEGLAQLHAYALSV